MTSSAEFTTADVFEHAALIGKDIELIVNDYGNDVIEDIMPKIVYLLEQLEGLTEKQKENEEKIQELRIEKERLLIHTKRDEAIQREMEEKLYYLETLVTADTKQLQNTIKVLREQNDCLCDELDQRENEMIKIRSSGALPGDVEVMIRMKATIDDQRDQIRQLNGQLFTKKKDVDAIQEHADRLSDINEQLRFSNVKLNGLVKEYRLNNDVTEHNSFAQSQLEDLSKLNLTDTTDNVDQLNSSSLSDEFALVSDSIAEELEESFDSNIETNVADNVSDVVTTSKPTSVASKDSIVVSKDPNRPRYTLSEMQKVLEERNIFKIRMTALEEELDLLKGIGPKIVKASYSESQVDSLKKRNNQSGVRSFMQKFMGK